MRRKRGQTVNQMNRKPNDFVVIILCHCRPYDTTTPATLRKFGYTGDIILLLDDEDPTIDEYRKQYPDLPIEIFSKDELLLRTDIMNSHVNKSCGVYARNVCFEVAEKYGYKYLCEMDDDYVGVPYRYIADNKLYRCNEVNLDKVFDAYIEFLNASEDIEAVAFAEPGDFVGGTGSNLNNKGYIRKCMGSWIMRASSTTRFLGLMNDDVNAYLINGSRGKIYITYPFIMIDTPATQSVSGGMTEVYKGTGTYTKTFYTVVLCPSFVKIDMFGDKHYRIHHRVKWDNAVPKIVSSRYRK